MEPVQGMKRSKSAQRLFQNLHERKENAKKIVQKLVQRLDTTTNARSTFFLILVFYLLGKSLNYYLIYILFLYAYLMVYRFMRFWIKKSLMYMLDFIYFGNISLIIFITLHRDSVDFFLAVFSCATGVISLTVLVDNNEIELADTDFLTSTFLDVIPFLTTYAIRWKHLLYRNVESDLVVGIGDVKYEFFNWTTYKLILLPCGLWLMWSLIYLTLNGKFFRRFAYSDLFESTIYKFYHTNSLGFLLGSHKKLTIIKYLISQFLFLVISIPIVISCFYSFYFSTCYIVFIACYLGYNSARGKAERLKSLMKKAKVHNE